jgi:hypothetical protein
VRVGEQLESGVCGQSLKDASCLVYQQAFGLRVLRSMFARQAISVSEWNVRGKCDQLTIPSPIDDRLCPSLENSGRSNLFSFSLEPDVVRVGLWATVIEAPAVELLRQTNLSKSSSSLHSLSVICLEHVLEPPSTRLGPKLSILA